MSGKNPLISTGIQVQKKKEGKKGKNEEGKKKKERDRKKGRKGKEEALQFSLGAGMALFGFRTCCLPHCSLFRSDPDGNS